MCAGVKRALSSCLCVLSVIPGIDASVALLKPCLLILISTFEIFCILCSFSTVALSHAITILLRQNHLQYSAKVAGYV
jgi:hypothetical protein